LTDREQHALVAAPPIGPQDTPQLAKPLTESEGSEEEDTTDSMMLSLPPTAVSHPMQPPPHAQASLNANGPSAPPLSQFLASTQHLTSEAHNNNSLFSHTNNRHTYAHDLLSKHSKEATQDETASMKVAVQSQQWGLSSLPRGDSYAISQHPTGSHSSAPGPYHQANCRLRHLIPHYNVSVTVTTSWPHILLTAAAVLCFLGYVGIRIWYLVSGRTAAFSAQNTSVAYSWVVLVAEVAVSVLGFYGSQLYWRQSTTFSEMSADELEALTQVRSTYHFQPLQCTLYGCASLGAHFCSADANCILLWVLLSTDMML
jgi:hypothetical protein